MREAWQGFGLSLGFLSRLPAPVIYAPAPRAFFWALFWFPVVGGLLGLCVFGVARLSLFAGLDVFLTSALSVAAWALLTGALHLDGVADTFDGLSGGREPERRREIMQDSRIGAHGATALILVLVLKVFLISAGLERFGASLLMFAGAASSARFIVVCAISFFRYSSPTGLGAAYKAQAGPALAGLAALWLLPGSLFSGFWLAALAAILLCGAFATYLSIRFDGLTGDAYGALIEFAELAFLFGLLVA